MQLSLVSENKKRYSHTPGRQLNIKEDYLICKRSAQELCCKLRSQSCNSKLGVFIWTSERATAMEHGLKGKSKESTYLCLESYKWNLTCVGSKVDKKNSILEKKKRLSTLSCLRSWRTASMVRALQLCWKLNWVDAVEEALMLKYVSVPTSVRGTVHWV